tara:strand:- start:1549 stop:1713 length:165 start_codon:yes stop_codon:yes gene_type:complete
MAMRKWKMRRKVKAKKRMTMMRRMKRIGMKMVKMEDILIIVNTTITRETFYERG